MFVYTIKKEWSDRKIWKINSKLLIVVNLKEQRWWGGMRIVCGRRERNFIFALQSSVLNFNSEHVLFFKNFTAFKSSFPKAR